MNQQIKLRTIIFFRSFLIHPLLLWARTLFFCFFNMFCHLRCVITNTGCLFCSNTSKYRQTEQQFSGHTIQGCLSIVVVIPPTMRPSSLGFSGSRGTPEVLTNIFITNSTFYIMSNTYEGIDMCLWFFVFYVHSFSLQCFKRPKFLRK